MAPRPLRVVLACPGLDHARRGFETFARECAAELAPEDGLELTLVKGSGPPAPGERAVRTPTRDAAPARALARLTGREAFRFEQVAFAAALQPLLRRQRPDVVLLSEWHTAVALALLRPPGRGPRLVLSNGTMADRGFGHLDRVQQLTPVALEAAVAHGADPARQTLLPLGHAIAPRLRLVDDDERRALRRRWELPQDRRVVVSVAALDRAHKRVDRLIEEVARLPAPRPFLLLAGEPTPDAPGLERLAREALGADGFRALTVAPAEVTELLRASDAFVLASLGEAQGRAMVEAMAQGLPCIAHDYPVAHFALGPHGRVGDLARPGVLAGLLAEAQPDPAGAEARHRFAFERFSWAVLRPRYTALLRDVAAAPPLRDVDRRALAASLLGLLTRAA